MRISSFLFLASLATLPIQLGKFFWSKSSFVLGIPIDYLAVSLYLSDLVIISYLVVFFLENFKNLGEIYRNRRTFFISLMLLNLYVLLSGLFVSDNKLVSLFFSLKLFEFGTFCYFSSFTINDKKIHKLVFWVLALSALWESIVVVLQFVFQRSINIWILGERSFDSSTVGIAHIEIFGRQLLRPYGTFPHPNVAAAYLAIVFIIIIPYVLLLKKKKYLYNLVIPIALLVTFSKGAALALIAAVFVLEKSIKILIITVILLFSGVVIFLVPFPQSQVATIAERLTLSQVALDLSLKNPLFGVGSANFIGQLAKLDLLSSGEVRLLQPVHNVFLLIVSENGIFGLLLFSYLLIVVSKNINSRLKLMLFIEILVFLSIDHFLWTLQQGKFLFWFTLGYIVGSQKK